MSYSAIITHVHPGTGSAPRLACTRNLAEWFIAHLIGVGAAMVPPTTFDNGYYALDAEWTVAMRLFCPARSSEGHPNNCSAVELRDWTSPLLSATSMASGADRKNNEQAERQGGDVPTCL